MSVARDDFDTAATYQLAIEASPSGVLVTDAEGTIHLVNSELERQFGYGRSELLGQRVDLLVPEVLRQVEAACRQGADAPRAQPALVVGLQWVGRRKDGSPIAVEIGWRPIQTVEGRFVIASVVDISERRQVQVKQHFSLEQQLEFERFVAELSFQFINLPSDQVIDGIREGLRRIGQEFHLERCAFVRVSPDGVLFEPVTWTAPGIPSVEMPLPARTRFPWAVERLLAGELLTFSTLADVPNEIDRTTFGTIGTKSAVYAPLSVDGRVTGAVGFSTIRAERTWPPEVVHRLKIFASVFEQVLARQQRDEAMLSASREVQRLKDRLHAENVYLRLEERERLGLTSIVGQSAAIRRVLEQIRQVAGTDSTVLLLGETGTGKELFAAQIHELGSRQGRTMVRVNCGAIPATLIESELFGREKGAFTGALSRQVGRFELADHSTIFLDEIGDLPPEVQVKLLRVLEERQIERLGSPRPISIDTRIVAATHRNLEQRISEGAFREDLYYRLNVFPIHVPPLRERAEDIPLLVWRFVEEFSKTFGKRIDTIDKDSLTALQHYGWPGNIRELRNVVERAMITASSKRLSITLPQSFATPTKRSPKLRDVEKEHIRAVLEATRWRIRGAGGAAERLGLKPTTLETRMAKLGLRRPVHS
jgi:formate hydrogenlyase transcriptional activator